MDEQMIQVLMNLIRTMPCEVNYVVKKKPKGVHITIDITKEEMDSIFNQ